MGVYITSTSISLILPGYLKNNTTTSDTAGVNIFMRQVDNAESKVNSVIASRYDITGFTATPPLLTKLTEDIAVYGIIRASNYRADDRNEYMDDYEKAEDTLQKLINGEINLTYTNGSNVGVLSSNRFLSSSKDYTPVFGMDDAEDWKRDEDEVDDQSNARD